LEICLLAGALGFAALQVMDWAPAPRAQATVSSTAGIALGRWEATADTTDIIDYGNTLDGPGYYRLRRNLTGTKGPALFIPDGQGIEILGNGYAIVGDGVADTEYLDRESGIYVYDPRGLVIRDLTIKKTDIGIQILNTGKSRGMEVAGCSFESGPTGIAMLNKGTMNGTVIRGNTFTAMEKYAVDIFNYYRYRPEDPIPDMETTSVIGNVFRAGGAMPYSAVDFLNFGRLAHTVVSGNVIEGYQEGGVVLHHVSNETMQGFQVSDNTFRGNGKSVYLANNEDGVFRQVGINDNTFTDNVNRYEIYEFPGGNINLYGGGEDISVWNNRITGGEDLAGIRVAGGGTGYTPHPYRNLRIERNTIQGMTGNDSTDNAASGIHFYNMSDTGPVGTASRSSSWAAPLVRHNAFIGNAGPGIRYTKGTKNPLPAIDATDNYWGDPAGPAGPQGDGTQGDVVATQWLTAPPAYLYHYLPLIRR
jgi:hypothetical protein